MESFVYHELCLMYYDPINTIKKIMSIAYSIFFTQLMILLVVQNNLSKWKIAIKSDSQNYGKDYIFRLLQNKQLCYSYLLI